MTPGAPVFKQLGQFHQDLDELTRQVNQFEQNVGQTFSDLAGTFVQPRLRPTNRKTASYVAGFLDMVLADSSLGNLTISLPAPVRQLQGLPIGIVRLSAAHTITVLPLSGTINGASTATLAATIKLYLFYSDGANWWSL